MKDNYHQFTQVSYSGRELLKKHALTEEGIWEVRGEDPNPDMGGPHSNPYIGTYQGTLAKVIAFAVNHPNFWQWGAGGVIRKIEVQIPEAKLPTKEEEIENLLDLILANPGMRAHEFAHDIERIRKM